MRRQSACNFAALQNGWVNNASSYDTASVSLDGFFNFLFSTSARLLAIHAWPRARHSTVVSANQSVTRDERKITGETGCRKMRIGTSAMN